MKFAPVLKFAVFHACCLVSYAYPTESSTVHIHPFCDLCALTVPICHIIMEAIKRNLVIFFDIHLHVRGIRGSCSRDVPVDGRW
jgi:hypothetical protein